MVLEWFAGPLADIIADTVAGIVMQAECSIASAQCEFELILIPPLLLHKEGDVLLF